jgi:hypothetical protein
MSANPQEPPPPGARTGYVTTVVRGLASTVGGPARWRDMAVGAALEGGDVARLMLGSLRWGVAQPRIRINRQVVTTQARVERRLDQLAERGAAGQLSERRRAAEILDAAVTAVATSAVLERVIDIQLERVIRPVIQVVLDDVLSALENEPERIQGLVRGQRDSMVDELVGRIRSGAAAGDSAMDRFTDRMFHRDGPPMPAPPAAMP